MHFFRIHTMTPPVGCVLVLAALVASCSHTSPYFRSELSEPAFRVAEGQNQIRSRIILVGDAGEMDASVLGTLTSWASQIPGATIVAFLGDNMYPEGMTARYRPQADQRILPQIDAATGAGARALFVPGNHDWADGSGEGYEAIRAQARYVDDHLSYSDGFLPRDGCPGPVAVDRLDGVRVVALDTQWWLHEEEKPTTGCPQSNPDSVVAAMSQLLDTDRHVVIVAHHPLFGYGRHAGFSDWKDHLFIPVVGSLIALSRKLPLRDQDYNAAPYQRMVEAFTSALSSRERTDELLVWAAGHEHNLQVLEGDADDGVDYVLISGSGAKTTPVNHGDETLFAHSRPGFMVLDVMMSGSTLLRVVEPDAGEVFTHWLWEEAAGSP